MPNWRPFGDSQAAFEADITLDISLRRSTVHNGIRWNIRPCGDAPQVQYMIFPEFLGPDRSTIPQSAPLPERALALMHIADRSRTEQYKELFPVSTRFQVMEGPNVMGQGVVTRWMK